ncbi:hypothetical protein BPUTSESOX_2112 [uncultured Gammaproteobacteria bacterium]|nr:hypothetical protein [uncultured Gammaproteobacteria bacterium]CAC9589461.1 hypothetical protein [uncultured Gammaproteobacteria bacterium]CAC9630217.1 hypothetical protein [uncultured Gammaproteobacteria bacterium]VVH51935.1 hypothetical protein BPUTSESOX_2112 [uncultured Gammaproteobacteria bacterium]
MLDLHYQNYYCSLFITSIILLKNNRIDDGRFFEFLFLLF